MAIKISSFTIDQSMQLASDQWEVVSPSSEAFTAELATADIASGLLDALGDPQLVEHIAAGIVDEQELMVTHSAMAAKIRGRDAAAKLVDTTLYVTYGAGGHHPATSAGAAPGFPGSVTQLNSGFSSAVVVNERLQAPGYPKPYVRIPGVTEPLYLPGKWRASAICADLATRAGLDACAYQAPDYLLREEFAVAGTVLGAVQQLVSSFSQFEPSRVDVWVDGKTLVVRSRAGLAEAQTPGAETAGSMNTISVYDLRARSFLFRKKFLDVIRVLRLVGISGGLSVGTPVCQDIVTSQNESSFFDSEGLVSKIVETIQQRRPDNAILGEVRETYTRDPDGGEVRLTTIERVVYGWDDLFTDADCRVLNGPLQRFQRAEVTALDDEGVFRPKNRVETLYAYDAQGQVVGQTTITEVFDAEENRWADSAMETRRYADNGFGKFQETVQTFVGGDAGWQPTSRQTAPGGGTRPGGGGRASTNMNDTVPTFTVEVIANVPGARDITIQNNNLVPDDMKIIAAQGKAASGATEVEVQFTAVGLPWIRRGQVIYITDLVAEDGVTPIPIQPFLVFEAHFVFDNSGPQPSYTSKVKAVYWTQQ